MAQWLKQSTAVTVKMGPFVDSSDGVTAETALTISQADIRLSKNGGAFAQTNNTAGATHDENGYYGVPLDTTDTNTLGTLRVAISESGVLPVWQDFMVVPANVWDSLFGSDKLQVDAVEISSDAAAADNAELAFDGTGYGFTGCTMPTVTTLTGHTPQTGDNYARLGAPAGASVSADIAAVKSETASIVADTNELQSDWADGGRLDLILDARASQTTVDAIETDTQDLQTQIGTAGAGLTAVPWNAAWDAEVQSEVEDAIVTNNLDHLCKTATVGADMTAEVADNTILSRILANGDTSAFDPSTDGLQPLRDTAPHGTAMRGTDNAATAAALTTHDGKLDTVDSNVDSILADTGTDGVAIATATAQAIADELLKRGVGNVEDGADAHSLATIILATLESSLSGTTWTIKKTDGSTFTTKTVTTDDTADPITAVT